MRYRVSRDKIVRIAQTVIVEANSEQEAMDMAIDPDLEFEIERESGSQDIRYENNYAEEYLGMDEG